MDLAKLIASWSKDPSTKVGAVLAQNNQILSTGYNGFPRYVDDTEERLTNREVKLGFTVHAEVNAILFADRPSIVDATLYTWPLPCCIRCAAIVAQSGIKRVVSPSIAEDSRWYASCMQGRVIMQEAGMYVEWI